MRLNLFLLILLFQATEKKTTLTPRHSLNASLEPSPGRALMLVEASRADCQFYLKQYSHIYIGKIETLESAFGIQL